MGKYGKINMVGDLVLVGNVIQEGNTTIINPTPEDYAAHGYKEVTYDQSLPDKESFNTERYFTETENGIRVGYRYVEILDQDGPALDD